MESNQSAVEFNNAEVQGYFEKLLKIPKRLLHKAILPPVGKELVFEDVVYKVTYTRTNPFRVTLEPIGVVDDEVAKALKEESKAPADHFKPADETK